jgi:hypothetical protein
MVCFSGMAFLLLSCVRKATHVPAGERPNQLPSHSGYKGEVKASSALLVAAIAGAAAAPARAGTVRGSAFADTDGDGLFSAGRRGCRRPRRLGGGCASR